MMAKVKTVRSFESAKPTILAVEWGDGKKSEYDIAKLDAAVIAQVTWHGLKQKLMDAHSATFKETGSVAKCREASDAVWQNLLAGEFNSERTGNPWIIEAIVSVFDVEEDRAREIWAALDKKAQSAIFADPAIIKWKAKRDLERAEGAESKVDIAGLFAAKPGAKK